MNKQLDRKVWKAAKKVKLIVHKIRNVATLDAEEESLFVVFAKRQNGSFSFQGVHTAQDVIDAAIEIDVPCVSKGH